MAITDPLCRSFLDLWWHFDPAAATQAGVQGHDGRLGAFDAGSIREHVAALRSIAGAVEELELEDTADEIDRTALLDHLRVLQFQLERELPWERNPALWLDHLIAAFGGLLARPPGDAQVGAAALDRLRAVPRFLKDARAAVRSPPLILRDTALAQLPGLSALFAAAAERFAGDWSAEAGEAAAALTEAHTALEQYGAALRALAPDPDPHAVALGEEAVDRRLHHEHASIHNAAEVWRGALRLAAEVEREVTALAAVIDSGPPWREVYGSLAEAIPVWSELQAEFREALAAATHCAESQGLSVDAPRLDLQPLPAAAAVLEATAVYRPAGAAPAALLIGDPERVAVPWLAGRLGVPGVHLHRSRTDRLPGLVRRHLGASSTSLGWELYAQELLVELRYADSPEARLVERVLFLRDVHLALADLGLHTRQLMVEEAVAQLTRRVPGDSVAALADVRRIACRPTSACAALLGRQELRRLRDDARAARGEAFSLDEFHRELFGYGALPVPLIRWGMALDG